MLGRKGLVTRSRPIRCENSDGRAYVKGFLPRKRSRGEEAECSSFGPWTLSAMVPGTGAAIAKMGVNPRAEQKDTGGRVG